MTYHFYCFTCLSASTGCPPFQLSPAGGEGSLARELTWGELGGGKGIHFTQTTCKEPMTFPSHAAAATLNLCHSPHTGLAAGELPMKSDSGQQEERFWGARVAGGRQGKFLLASVASSHKLSSHAQDLLQYSSCVPGAALAARLQLLRERSFSHILSAVPNAGQGYRPLLSLPLTPWWWLHPSSMCIWSSDLHPEFLLIQLSVPSCYLVTHQIPYKIPLPFSLVTC